jgi:hypothetical protein
MVLLFFWLGCGLVLTGLIEVWSTERPSGPGAVPGAGVMPREGRFLVGGLLIGLGVALFFYGVNYDRLA